MYFIHCLSSFLCVWRACVQDGGQALEEMLHHNTSITELDVRLTEASEKSISVIATALLANQEGLEALKKGTTEDSESKEAENKAG